MTDFTEKKFGIISLGCDKNRVDSEKILAIIQNKGCKVIQNTQDVQILIINTCAFLNEARKEAIDTILEFASLKENRLEKIVVCGCLPQKFIEELYPALTEADVFLGINDYNNLFDALEKSYENGRVNYVGCGCNTDYITDRQITTPQHYAYLKIADGCDNRCTYCLIPKIRGKYTSYPMEKLVEEAQALGDVSELIIVAQDVTRYGIDLYGQKKLTEILQKLTALVNINSVRLLYCYPEMIDDALIEEIATNDKIIKYIDIPLQHSEDRILKLMNRKGSREEYIKLIEKLRKAVPGIAVRSTFITGFPSETDEEHRGLCGFLERVKLDNCGFFSYSREPDTPAYKLKGQIPASEKKRRLRELYKIQSGINRQRLESYIGKKISVICDGIDYNKNSFVGRAYFSMPDADGKVYFRTNSAVQGQYYDVLIESCTDYDLYGRTEDYEQ